MAQRYDAAPTLSNSLRLSLHRKGGLDFVTHITLYLEGHTPRTHNVRREGPQHDCHHHNALDPGMG
ncbi:hypothetical protein C8E99_2620 [Citricoccus muralis]|uniref:Uncharacterized protein n=1 Tax=Citricoccus muralis TaxID=169134 RepID=A0A3D9LEG9_9MICC|nr:hypothetical protein C8E99_2620 [Citricoccus muralis]